MTIMQPRQSKRKADAARARLRQFRADIGLTYVRCVRIPRDNYRVVVETEGGTIKVPLARLRSWCERGWMDEVCRADNSIVFRFCDGVTP